MSEPLTYDSAPRDVPRLCQWSSYALLLFAERDLKLLEDPSVSAAFHAMNRTARAEHIAQALKLMDAKNGRAAAPEQPVQQPAPQAPVVQAPTAPQAPAAPAPAVTGRKPRNSNAKPPEPAPQVPAAAAPQAPTAQPDAGAIGLLAQLKDELSVVKANGEGLGKNVLGLSQQVEALSNQVAALPSINQKLDAVIWLLGQIAEATVGGDSAQDIIAASFKQTGKA